MEHYWLTALVGFLFDTTLAAAHLVFAGVPERYPEHPLGADATWAGRCHTWPSAATAATRHSRTAAQNIAQPPTEYFKQFYYDTVNFNPDAIEFAITFAGADHILAGSDYPHQIGSIPKMLDALGRHRRHRRTAEGDSRRQRRESC